jgi:hypothetical protein
MMGIDEVGISHLDSRSARKDVNWYPDERATRATFQAFLLKSEGSSGATLCIVIQSMADPGAGPE